MRRVVLACVLSLLALLMCSSSGLAIGNPDSVSIGDVYVFEDVLETGDAWVYVRYDVSYASQPTEDSEDTFLVAIYDTDGTTLLFTRALNYYQHNIIAIQLTASTNTLVSGSSYYVRVMGSPALFVLQEFVNMRTRALTAGDYRVPEDLAGLMVSQAGILEADWGVTLLTSSDKLNTTGAYYFNKAMPGLASAAPEIFELSTGQFIYTRNTSVGTEGLNRTILNMPESLNSALNGLDAMLGVEESNWGQFGWLLVIGLVVGAAVYGASRRPDVSLLGGTVGSMGLGAYLGVANGNAMLFVMAVGTFIIVLFAIEYVLPRYG